MDNKLYSKLSAITVEESRILSGNPAINKKLYMSGMDSIVDSAKLLSEGRIITCRPHTRFIHFPAHRHNYIEMVYMYSGETHHVVDGNHIFLKQGELLFLSEKASHEIYPAGVNDIAVNFIILPEFFTRPLDMIGDDSSPLHDFLVKGLLGNEIAPSYLHFKASDILAVQNLAENLIWAIETDKSSMRAVNNITMGELFLSLLGYCTFQDIKSGNKDQELMIAVLNYIDENYRYGSLAKLASKLKYRSCWLSKEIRRISGGETFSDLMMAKRLDKACFLLKNTTMKVIDISYFVGYENVSYFHRIFNHRYGMSPRDYRLSE